MFHSTTDPFSIRSLLNAILFKAGLELISVNPDVGPECSDKILSQMLDRKENFSPHR